VAKTEWMCEEVVGCTEQENGIYTQGLRRPFARDTDSEDWSYHASNHVYVRIDWHVVHHGFHNAASAWHWCGWLKLPLKIRIEFTRTDY